jgi:hypothetical protein
MSHDDETPDADLPLADPTAAGRTVADSTGRAEQPVGLGRRWWPLAAVVGIALVAGGGVVWAAGQQRAVGAGDAGSRSPLAVADGVAASAFMLAGQNLEFRDAGLSTATGHADVWAFDPAAVLTSAAVRQAAEAFGLAGEPTAGVQAWTVGPADGSGPALTISADALASLSYLDPSLGCVAAEPPDARATIQPVPAEPAGGRPTAQPVPAEPPGGRPTAQPVPVEPPGGLYTAEPAPAEPAAAPGPAATQLAPAEPAAARGLADGPAVGRPAVTGSTGDGADGSGPRDAGSPSDGPTALCAGSAPDLPTAITRVRALLAALGVNVDGAAVSGSQDGLTTIIQVQPRVDGMAVDLSWSVTLVGDRVQSAWGPLAPLVDLGSYPLISPAQAVVRLSDPRFGWPGMPVGLAPASTVGAAGGTTAGSTGGTTAGSTGGTTAGSAGGTTVGSTPAPTVGSAGGTTAGPADTATRGSAGESTVGIEPRVTASGPAPDQSVSVAPLPRPGARLAWPVRKVSLDQAELIAQPSTLGGGATVLLPTYRLTDTEGGTWQIAAVAEDALDLTAS